MEKNKRARPGDGGVLAWMPIPPPGGGRPPMNAPPSGPKKPGAPIKSIASIKSKASPGPS